MSYDKIYVGTHHRRYDECFQQVLEPFRKEPILKPFENIGTGTELKPIVQYFWNTYKKLNFFKVKKIYNCVMIIDLTKLTRNLIQKHSLKEFQMCVCILLISNAYSVAWFKNIKICFINAYINITDKTIYILYTLQYIHILYIFALLMNGIKKKLKNFLIYLKLLTIIIQSSSMQIYRIFLKICVSHYNYLELDTHKIPSELYSLNNNFKQIIILSLAFAIQPYLFQN